MKNINQMTLREAAKHYIEQGYKIVPRIPGSKKFFVTKKSGNPGSIDNPLKTVGQIDKVWNETPAANISIVAEDLIIVDIDQHEKTNGVGRAKNLDLPRTLSAFTPNNGLHLFYRNGNSQKIKKADGGIDIISGHYGLMVPPSIVGGKKYQWANNRTIIDFPKDVLHSEISQQEKNKEQVPGKITAGERNDQLTKIAGIYAGKGLDYDFVFDALWGVNISRCEPPLEKEEIKNIANSILNREAKKEVNSLKTEIEEWVKRASGYFNTRQLDNELEIKTKKDRDYRSQVLNKMDEVKRGPQRGVFYVSVKKRDIMKFSRKKATGISLPLPLDLSCYTKILPKNIILVAGSKGAGKSAFMLNLAYNILNCKTIPLSELMGESVGRNAKLGETSIIADSFSPEYHQYKGTMIAETLNLELNKKPDPILVSYLNSEMGEEEFTLRTDEFPGGMDSFLDHTNFEVVKNILPDPHTAIDPDGINIVDYLEINDKFWLIGEKLQNIHNALNQGIAIVGIQKASDKNHGRGGQFTTQLPRLAITLDNNIPHGHIVTVTTNKIPLNPRINLNGMSMDFKLGGGAWIKPISDWRYVKNQKERDWINALYDAETETSDEIGIEVDEDKI